jgi:hypothetical protein
MTTEQPAVAALPELSRNGLDELRSLFAQYDELRRWKADYVVASTTLHTREEAVFTATEASRQHLMSLSDTLKDKRRLYRDWTILQYLRNFRIRRTLRDCHHHLKAMMLKQMADNVAMLEAKELVSAKNARSGNGGSGVGGGGGDDAAGGCDAVGDNGDGDAVDGNAGTGNDSNDDDDDDDENDSIMDATDESSGGLSSDDDAASVRHSNLASGEATPSGRRRLSIAAADSRRRSVISRRQSHVASRNGPRGSFIHGFPELVMNLVRKAKLKARKERKRRRKEQHLVDLPPADGEVDGDGDNGDDVVDFVDDDDASDSDSDSDESDSSDDDDDNDDDDSGNDAGKNAANSVLPFAMESVETAFGVSTVSAREREVARLRQFWSRRGALPKNDMVVALAIEVRQLRGLLRRSHRQRMRVDVAMAKRFSDASAFLTRNDALQSEVTRLSSADGLHCKRVAKLESECRALRQNVSDAEASVAADIHARVDQSRRVMRKRERILRKLQARKVDLQALLHRVDDSGGAAGTDEDSDDHDDRIDRVDDAVLEEFGSRIQSESLQAQIANVLPSVTSADRRKMLSTLVQSDGFFFDAHLRSGRFTPASGLVRDAHDARKAQSLRERLRPYHAPQRRTAYAVDKLFDTNANSRDPLTTTRAADSTNARNAGRVTSAIRSAGNRTRLTTAARPIMNFIPTPQEL